MKRALLSALLAIWLPSLALATGGSQFPGSGGAWPPSGTPADLLDGDNVGGGLGANPTPCTSGLWVNDIAQDGTLACLSPADFFGFAIVDDPPNFVGTIHCPTEITGATVSGCVADVSQFAGQVFTGGTVHLYGNYVVADPDVATGGFKVVASDFNPSCSADVNGCAPIFNTFETAVGTAARSVDETTQSIPNVPIRFAAANYAWKGCTPFHVTQNNITLDWTADPLTEIFDKRDCETALPNVTLDGLPTPTTTITFASTVCGAGTCTDGDEILRPGMKILLTGNGRNWLDSHRATDVVIVHLLSTDGLSATLMTPYSADYSGAASAASGRIWDIDPTVTTAGGVKVRGTMHIVGGLNFAVPNAWEGTQGDTATKRVVPLTVAVVRAGTNQASFDATTFCHKHDTGIVTTVSNTSSAVVAASELWMQRGISCPGAGGAKYQLTGNDDTTSADDGWGAIYQLQTPNVVTHGGGTAISSNTAVLTSGQNCGNDDIDWLAFEDTHTILEAPLGCQNLEIGPELSREQGLQCAAAGSGGNDCPDAAARRCFVNIGNWHANPGTSGFGAAYRILGGKVWFSLAARPFLCVTGATRSTVAVNLNVEDTTDLFNIDNAGTTVVGQIGCEGSGAGACDPPAVGDVSGLYIYDAVTGAPTGGGIADALHDNVAGEIAAIADKATPVGADHLVIEDSAAANAKKHATVESLESALELVLDLDQLQGNLTGNKVNGFTINRCIRSGATGALEVHTGDCGSGGGGGDLVKSGLYADNELLCAVNTGTGVKACLAGARVTPSGLEFPAAADGERLNAFYDNTLEPSAPTDTTPNGTHLYSLGGEFYKKDETDGANERLMLNSGNVSGHLTVTPAGVATVTDMSCADCIGSPEIGALDAADTTTGVFSRARGGLGGNASGFGGDYLYGADTGGAPRPVNSEVLLEASLGGIDVVTGNELTKTCRDYSKLVPVDADDHFMFKAPAALTITDIDCITIGGTSIAMDVQQCAADGTSCLTVDAPVTCDSNGAADDGAFSNGGVDAGEWLRLVYAVPSGSVGSVTVSVCFTQTVIQ